MAKTMKQAPKYGYKSSYSDPLSGYNKVMKDPKGVLGKGFGGQVSKIKPQPSKYKMLKDKSAERLLFGK
jgi:hypothetical protein